MLLIEPEIVEQWIKDKNITVFDSLPEGWSYFKGKNGPAGYRWAHNRGNPFKKGESKRALVKRQWNGPDQR